MSIREAWKRICVVLACAVMTAAAGCGGQGGNDAGNDAVADVGEDAVIGQDTVADAPDGLFADARDAASNDTTSVDVVTPDAPDVTTDTAVDTANPDANPDVDQDVISDADDPDADDPDVPCVQDCTGLSCGLDPVCGQSCGECKGDGENCEDGQCVVNGCYMEALGVCMDQVVAAPGSTVDWDFLRQMCEGEGGLWQACPTVNRLVSARFVSPSGSSYVDHYYLGLYCSAAEARGYVTKVVALNYEESTITFPFSDDELTCTGPNVADTIACDMPYPGGGECVQLGGGIEPERFDAFSRMCTEFRDGIAATSCPRREGATCEQPPYGQELPYEGPGTFTLTRYYGNHAMNVLESQCVAKGGKWLATQYASQDIPYGECTVTVNGAAYPAGDFQPEEYDMLLTGPSVEGQPGATGYACCYAAPDEAFGPAWDALIAVDDMKRCEPCVPDCSSVVCGVDPVCGQTCGTCTVPGAACVSNDCVVQGCNYLSQGYCVDRYVDEDGSVPWAAMQSDCENSGGEWGECPIFDMMATIRLVPFVGFTIDQHFYRGLFCAMGNVQEYVAANYEDPADYTVIGEDYTLTCGMPSQGTIACYKASDDTCEELSGTLAPERTAWFTDVCENVRGGEIRAECPQSELAICEYTQSWMPGVDRIFHFYAADTIDAGHAECNGVNGTWLETDCTTGPMPYGTCMFDYKNCRHPAGSTQAQFYEVWLTETSVPVTVYACCHPTESDAANAALTNLLNQLPLGTCS